ncbi:alpha-N-arabinofuranosidase [Rhodohalobacter sp. 8-1]|uniref:alpha-N-arabinofuranosidase n=1 Tax=Rhodohalobacter sp. 8-1 TaxID=3131972 RepID=UPI0030EBA5C1
MKKIKESYKFIIALVTTIFLINAQSVAQQNRVIIHADQPVSEISKHIYGQFAEHLGRGIYGGIWVGEDSDIPNTEGYRNDVLEALRDLDVPNVRWPGGCFADEYHWRDGIGPKDERPVRINTHWGMVEEDNSFGTHEFLRFMELIDAEPVIAMNLGSGTPREMAQWLEYLNYDGESTLANLRRENGRDEPWGVKYIGVGNESWGCGGNMTVEYYADLYRRYATFTKEYSGHELYRVASGWSDDQYGWTEHMMQEAAGMMEGISLHYYTIPTGNWSAKGSSVDFDEELYFAGIQRAAFMDEYIQGHSNRMDKFDPEKNVDLVVDEWGIWTDPLPGTNPGFLEQQNSLRDALIASITLDILNKHSDRVRMANIAQMVNVLQAMILTEGDQMIKTPTYHVFDLYRIHHDTNLLYTHVQNMNAYEFGGESIPVVSMTVSASENGAINITLTNKNPDQSEEIELEFRGGQISEIIEARTLTGSRVNSVNAFSDPENVIITDFSNYSLDGDILRVTLPSKSVTSIVLQ